MKIGIDASQANKQERTGTEWYAFSIIKEWARTNAFGPHKVFLYTRNDLLNDFGPLPSMWNVKVLRWPPQVLWTHLRLSWEMFVHPVDALFIPSHIIPLIHAKRTFTTIHDIGFEHAEYVYGKHSVVHIQSSLVRRILSLLVRLFTFGAYGANELDYQRFGVRFALRHATELFTVSEFSKREIEKKFHPRQQLTVAYNGVDLTEYDFSKVREHIGASKKKYALSDYVLSIGRIEHKKNSLALVQAFDAYIHQYPKESLKLVFAGGEGYGSLAVKDYIRTHDLNQQVLLLGWVPNNDLAPLLAGARCFVFLSEYEGFGVPIIQSLSLGTPVLANDLEVFREIAGDAITYCDVHNPTDITNKLAQLVKEKERVPRVDIVRKFQWEKTAQIISTKMLFYLQNTR